MAIDWTITAPEALSILAADQWTGSDPDNRTNTTTPQKIDMKRKYVYFRVTSLASVQPFLWTWKVLLTMKYHRKRLITNLVCVQKEFNFFFYFVTNKILDTTEFFWLLGDRFTDVQIGHDEEDRVPHLGRPQDREGDWTRRWMQSGAGTCVPRAGIFLPRLRDTSLLRLRRYLLIVNDILLVK